MNSEKKENAIDLSYHISDLARSRQTSPLKGLSKYMGRPGVISLAGGLPSAAYFPFSTISGEALVSESFPVSVAEQSSSLSWLWKIFGASSPSKEKTSHLSIPKYPSRPDEVNLSAALQYGTATGLPQLQGFLKDFVDRVYQPAYSDYTTLVHTGNTDGWSRVASTLCNPGEGILTEEWTYPSALASVAPVGIQAVPIAMDKEGMRSDSLRATLEQWDEKVRGIPRPHVMYTVPIGQNPSGATMGLSRKKEIYDICVEYDVIIVEDDPYFFLQEGQYIPKARRVPEVPSTTLDAESRYISSLAPSYLRIDYQGRVVRLDTFSKTIAPGSRLGWFTCNPVFAERLERAGEVSTQAPCGFGQSLITQLLINWKYDGYIRWLRGLGAQYKMRRDYFIDCLLDEFDVKPSVATEGCWTGCDVYVAFSKPPSQGSVMSEKSVALRKPLFSFVPPTSGMFVWLKIHFQSYPSYGDRDETLEMKLWVALAEAGVVLGPGWFFAADIEDSPDGARDGHFRISFSNAELDDLKKATQIFARIVGEFFDTS
ncbi:hypothetical protein JAAARDRAFT_201799 [Jaapia argillacea MUCL 33604]|uniref:Aminotransferase class I/classII large domain-containing protein n=1 Tax=Jaapia argillacea MUCL 33604 TaxID=933084 RepID=A0A067QPC0_9AGAM|nr:hypothetical protein JAAARDRAFT_201799 [Jaapia argillacea MUCL 33604]